ncbi:MAG: hypothetical protein HQM01_13055 [Magnetococcales bacterium]|nr:hypothetical protein [Magnetococcales bacterium]
MTAPVPHQHPPRVRDLERLRRELEGLLVKNERVLRTTINLTRYVTEEPKAVREKPPRS